MIRRPPRSTLFPYTTPFRYRPRARCSRRLSAVGARSTWRPAVAETAPKTERRSERTPTRGKTIVVMPALNAAKTLELTVSSIPRDVVDDVLLVDDRSTDETLEI